MIDMDIIYFFTITSALLALSPGPDNIYVLTLSISKGFKVAFITILGLVSGVIIHTSAAALGLSLILQTSEFAFDIIKYIGALYLLYLGYQAFKHRNESLDLDKKDLKINLKKLYIKGFIMNVLNPKVSIFFLAFLPQFVNPTLGNIPLQISTLGVIFMSTALIVFSIIAYMGNLLSVKIRQNPNIVTYMNSLTSFVLISLGLKLALSQR